MHPCFSQFVTIEGKGFRLNKERFVPIVANYKAETEFYTQSGVVHFIASPNGQYGASPFNHECENLNDCNVQLHADFKKIRSMGFNTIRVVGTISPQISSKFQPNFYFIRAFEANSYDGSGNNNNYINHSLSAPYFNGTIDNEYFNCLLNFLDQAEISGLKVILLVTDTWHDGLSPVKSQQQSDLFCSYLSALAQKLKDHPALFAYDLWNEPTWSSHEMMLRGGTNNDRLTKAQICNYERSWYQALKNVDVNHLVTIGGCGVDDLSSWNLGFLELDFYSLHWYPDEYQIDNFNIANGVQRMINMIYWLGKTSPIPWIIGETSFSADDDNTCIVPQWLDAKPEHHMYPYMQGDEEEQKQYIITTLDATRNSGGAGYSWWIYQNMGPCIDLSTPADINNVIDPTHWYQTYTGLLHFSPPTLPNQNPLTITGENKKAVSALQNYHWSGTNLSIVEPINYRDPFTIKSFYNPAEYNAIEGVVYDPNGNKIENAIVGGSNYLCNNPDPNHPGIITCGIYTFTDANGHFKLVPYNYMLGNSVENSRIIDLYVSAVGTSTEVFQGNNEQQINVGMIGTNGLIILKRYDLYSEKTIENEIVQINENKVYFDIKSVIVNSLTVEGNGNVGGTVDVHARENIIINPGFIAEQGSNVNIYTENVFPDCGDFTNYKKNEFQEEDNSQLNNKIKDFEISFLKPVDILVYPNPNEGSFVLSLINFDSVSKYIFIKDISGKIVFKQEICDNNSLINLNILSKGVYIINVNDKYHNFTKKIIIY